MQWLRHVKQWLLRRFARRGSPQAIPALLDEQALARALDEARFLSRNRVKVDAPRPGELPIPRRADE